MAKMTMVVDLDRCIGCYGCEIACKQENDVALGCYWNLVHEMPVQGEFPNNKMYWLPRACQQCMNPSCVEVCPTGASYLREDGRVMVDEEACIGCESCVKACPYGARSKDKRTNTVGKCNLCADLCDGGGEPACVKICVNSARLYGDMTDPDSDVSRALAEAGGGRTSTRSPTPATARLSSTSSMPRPLRGKRSSYNALPPLPPPFPRRRPRSGSVAGRSSGWQEKS